MEIFDTRVVARPPPPRPLRRSANPHYTIEGSCLTSNRIRHCRPAERLDTQKHHLRQTVLPHPLPQRHSRPVELHVNPGHNFGHRNRRGSAIVVRGSSLRVGHDGVMRVNLGQESKTPEARLPGIYTPGSYLLLSLSYPRLPPRTSYLWQCLAFCLSQWVDSPRSPSPTGAMGFGWDGGRSRRKTALVWPLAISHGLTCVANWSPVPLSFLSLLVSCLCCLAGWLAGWGLPGGRSTRSKTPFLHCSRCCSGRLAPAGLSGMINDYLYKYYFFASLSGRQRRVISGASISSPVT